METKQKIATLPDWIRDSIAEHRGWIEAALGTSLDKSLIVRVPNNFGSIAARRIMADVPLAPLKVGPTSAIKS
jgi:hypothetical protein